MYYLTFKHSQITCSNLQNILERSVIYSVLNTYCFLKKYTIGFHFIEVTL